jgi:hypothetical protein
MFEHRSMPLLPKRAFIRRLAFSASLGVLFIVFTLAIGMTGYHYLEGFPWLDAYVEATMIFSGMGSIYPTHTEIGKFFSGSYALFCGFALTVPTVVILMPIIHRYLHKFHIHSEK